MRTAAGGSRRGWLGIACVLAITGATDVHTRLDSSQPAEGAVVAEPPVELRLTFSEAVDPKLATVRVALGDAGSVELAGLTNGEDGRELVAPVPRTLPAGLWTVFWKVAGADGHPVEGEYAFTVESAFPGAEPEQAEPPPISMHIEEEQGITVESPAYVAARWLTFAAMLSTIGAVAFHFLVLRPTRAREPVLASVLDVADGWSARLGRGAALFLALAAGVRLLLQLEALGGGDVGLMRDLLLGTTWGLAWFVHVAGALIAAAAFHAVRRGRSQGWAVAAGAAVLIAFGTSYSSHAAASDLATIAVTSDMIHILAVSGWVGTLLVLVGVGIPAVMQEDPRIGRFSAVFSLIAAFSPRALVMASIAVVTGVLAAVLNLPALAALWQTEYGRMLLVKVALVAVVAGFGAWNWQRMKPRLEAGESPTRIRRTAAAELIAAALVLFATAVLVALPTP